MKTRKTAWLFPGQGAQVVGMGKDLCAAHPEAAATFRTADESLGFSISQVIFEGPDSELVRTEITQPAILTASVAALRATLAAHPDLPLPICAAGHSLGEYSALVASGTLAFADAVRLVSARGRSMQKAVPEGVGAMAAIMGLDPDALTAVCEQAARETGEVVSCANFNAPGQIVIAGTQAGVLRAQALASDQKGKAIPLKVSAPFHCALMAPAAREVDASLAPIAFAPLSFPVIANVDAAANADATRVRRLLVQQVDGAVRWEQSILAMKALGVTHAIEFGPGKVLANLMKRITKEIAVHNISEPAHIDALPAFLA